MFVFFFLLIPFRNTNACLLLLLPVPNEDALCFRISDTFPHYWQKTGKKIKMKNKKLHLNPRRYGEMKK